ncbi:hypothetical protein MHBO_000880 [Bonamia ostreae]|uniref:Uncharacterized protein n=1 Tax=Bonamia ostreae TaxID=126728 RepID=A0ABV2AH62_9EUKA
MLSCLKGNSPKNGNNGENEQSSADVESNEEMIRKRNVIFEKFKRIVKKRKEQKAKDYMKKIDIVEIEEKIK